MERPKRILKFSEKERGNEVQQFLTIVSPACFFRKLKAAANQQMSVFLIC